MKIALVTETYFPQVNGVSRTLDRLVRHLHAAGHSLLLVAPRYPRLPDVPDGVRLALYRGVPCPGYPEVSLCWSATAARLRRTLADFGAEVVHIATEGPLGWAALRACRSLSTAVVSSFHTQFAQYARFYRLGWLTPWVWSYLRWFHNRTRATLCPTPSIRAELRRRGFQGVEIWSRGVDATRFHPDRRSESTRQRLGLGPQDTAILYVGRLAAEKNINLLLQAFLRLERQHPARLILVGDGPARAALVPVADDRVTFAGYRYGDELAAIYASCDLFAFPSLTDTFGNVLLEAMASGLPAVGFRAPGPIDVIREGRTGLLAATVGAEPLANCLSALVRSPERRAAMARHCPSWAELQSWDSVNAVVTAAYRGALRSSSETLLPAAHAAAASDPVAQRLQMEEE